MQSNGELVAVESSLRADGLSLRAESIEFESTFSEANNNLNISSESLHSDDESVMMSSTTVIETGVLKNDGEIVAENIELEARDRVENTGKIIADRIPPLTVESGVVEPSSLLIETSVLTNEGEIAAENVELEARDSIENAGKIVSETDFVLRTNRLENVGGNQVAGEAEDVLSSVISGGYVNITAQYIQNSQALLVSDGALELSAPRLDNQDNGLIYSAGQLSIQTEQMNNNGASLYSLDNIVLDGETIFNHNVARIESEKTVVMTGAEFENDMAATLIGLEGIELSLQRLKHANQSIMYSNKNIRVDSESILSNESSIQTPEKLTMVTNRIDSKSDHIDVNELDITSEDLTLSGTNWLARDTIVMNSEAIDINTNSNVNANGSLDMGSDSLTMDQSKVSAESISIDANEVLIKNGLTELDPSQRVAIRYGLVGNTIQLNTENLNVQNGVIYADSSLQVGTDEDPTNTIDISQNSNLSSGDEMSLYSNEINSDSSKIVSNDSIDIQSNVINMEFSEVVSNGALDIDSDEIDIFGSSIQTAQISIDAKTLRSSSSRPISTLEQLLAGLSSEVAEQSIHIVNDAEISVDEWVNSGTFTSQELNVQADRLSNSGDIIIEGMMMVRGKSNDTAQFFDNSKLVYSGDGLDIQSDRIRSTGSVSNGAGIQSTGGLSLRANRMELRDLNTVGNIVARSLDGGSLEFTSLGSINSLGLIDIQGDEINLNNVRGNGIDIESERLKINKLRSDGSLDLITSQFVRSSSDQLSAFGDMTIRMNSDYNHRGLIAGLGGNNNFIIDGEFENNGTLFSAGYLTLTADQMTNQANRTISSLQNATFTIADTLTNYGKLITEKNLTINANELENLANVGSHSKKMNRNVELYSGDELIDDEYAKYEIKTTWYHSPRYRGLISAGGWAFKHWSND